MQVAKRSEAKKQGLHRYFTGVECCHGHLSERLTVSGACVECSRVFYWTKRGLEAPPKKVPFTAEEVRARANASQRRWAQANPEAAQRREKEWRERNREAVRAAHKAKYHANPQIFRERARNSRLKNLDAARAKHREWLRQNQDKCRIHDNNRRAKEAHDRLSRGIVKKLFAMQRGKCPVCRRGLSANYHIDHVVPLARGGRNVDTNVQLLCAACNQQKHAKDPIEFMQLKGFLL